MINKNHISLPGFFKSNNYNTYSLGKVYHHAKDDIDSWDFYYDIPSEINEKTNSITPPSKHILFNVNLKSNDGLLITHIAKKENISQSEAKNEVYKFSNDCNNKLSTSKILSAAIISILFLTFSGISSKSF